MFPLETDPIGSAAVVFFQSLGGALFISIGLSVFQTGVIRAVRTSVPGLDPEILLRACATEPRAVLRKFGVVDELPAVLKAYMVGLTDSFRVTISFAAIVAWCFDWKSVKDGAA
jgi:hypothetical protein